MNKQIKIRHLCKFSKLVPSYAPLTHFNNPIAYNLISSRFESFQGWPETAEITREEFEKDVCKNPELQEVYIEYYKVEAKFYHCKIQHDLLEFHYCLMCHRKSILFMFFRDMKLILL